MMYWIILLLLYKFFPVKIFVLVFILIPGILTAQDSLSNHIWPMKDGKITYEFVIDVDSTSKSTLYTRAKNWGISQYNSQKDALQVDDREGGILAYKGFFVNNFIWPPRLGISVTEDWQYWELLKILFKDNRVKIIISDFRLKSRTTSFAGSASSGIFDDNLDDFYITALERLKKMGNGEKYREKFKDVMATNFLEANAKILDWVESFKKAIKSGKSDFDF